MTEGTMPGTAGPGRRRELMSFVRRSSRLDKRLQKAWDAYAGTYLLELPQYDHRELSVATDFHFDREYAHSVWGNDNPLIVEIGTGQGENIVAAAQKRPDVNYLALEVYRPGVAHALLKAGKYELSNLRVCEVNAPDLMRAAEDGLFEEVWTFFPDPWPKTKHHKRRIVQSTLADEVHRALKTGGSWRIATDIEDYALHVHEVMDQRNDFDNVGDLTVSLPTEHVSKGTADMAAQLPHADFTESRRFEGRVLTNFEKKGIEAGRVIHDFTYRAV
ncbi:tRNA (guanosine(46)-N7)-methyltransferase TrmB [Bifidobacterium margollesii]|nr:tRNA (guanosine(46)-N7)-methyltransferase TrmB [Bifidobacterium margollesii]